MESIFESKPHIVADLDEEFSQMPLIITGEVPHWLSGTLIRNGPVNLTVNEERNAHWFDGLAMLHAFSFDRGRVVYTNKFLKTEAFRTVFEDGSLNYEGFACDPCRSKFKEFITYFFSSSQPQLHNANVNVAKIAKQFVALTEQPLPVKFDLKSLETLGVLDYQDALLKEKCFESAHPHTDPKNNDLLNYIVEFGPSSYYVLYKIKDGSSTREIIAKIPIDEPSYMHSFAMTENYLIFTEFPFVVNPQDLISSTLPFIKNYFWKPQKGTRFTVVNRHDGNIVGRYQTNPFFAFHHVNAFEKDRKIILDIVCYEDAAIIEDLGDHSRATSEKENWAPSILKRFTLDLNSGKITEDSFNHKFTEMPRINERYDGLPYQFIYMADVRDALLNNEIRPIYKVNAVTKEFQMWAKEGCYPGEPVFVASPDAKSEDDGVILSVVSDIQNFRSFLLILDAKSFKELARAVVSHAIPAGLHGQFF